jgi:DNA-binding MarR family transcriptional regulator
MEPGLVRHSASETLDKRRFIVYTSNMSPKNPQPVGTPCLCNALRQASRAVSRLYDDELRGVGLRTTQYSLLRWLRQSGEVRQGDLGELTLLDETTLTRNLRPLVKKGWVAVRAGTDRREKLVAITELGVAKLKEARPAWQQAQERMQTLLPKDVWPNLLAVLPDVARLASEA